MNRTESIQQKLSDVDTPPEEKSSPANRAANRAGRRRAEQVSDERERDLLKLGYQPDAREWFEILHPTGANQPIANLEQSS